MKAVVQRVSSAKVTIDNKITGSISKGLLIYLGVGQKDTEKEVDYFVNKIVNLRIFEDDKGKMNISTLNKGYELLVVSQFTLYGNVKKGFRPGFQDAADRDKAVELYTLFVDKLKETELKVEKAK